MIYPLFNCLSPSSQQDTLLDKLAHRELDIPEAEMLRGILTDEMQLRGRENGVIAYALIIGRLEQILYELRESGNEHRRYND